MSQQPSSMCPSDLEDNIDPLEDIIDYLVRCAKISFKKAHVDEEEVRTSVNIRLAHEHYKRSPLDFLSYFGKYMTQYHINYFENVSPYDDINLNRNFRNCVNELKLYHSENCRKTRVRNRRYKAMQKLQSESDYFSEKEMMYRNPLLYEQLVGRFLTEDEIKDRDSVDSENLTLLNMILDTVDRNHMRDIRNEQSLSETLEATDLNSRDIKTTQNKTNDIPINKGKWGEFTVPDNYVDPKPEVRQQAMISAPERRLLREEFLQEMYSSFIEGRDVDFDYQSIDNDDQYDDLQQVSRDAEEKYFDSESNDIENLEEHMKLTTEYKKEICASSCEDSLDVFMECLNKKIVDS